MQEPPVATLEYAHIIDSAEALRKRVRTITAWMVIVWSAASLLSQVLSLGEKISRASRGVRFLDAILSINGVRDLMSLASALIYLLILAAAILLLLDKRPAQTMLRSFCALMVALNLASYIWYYIEFRYSGPSMGLSMLLWLPIYGAFPILVLLLPLQSPRGGR